MEQTTVESVVAELRASKYQSTAEYALRDFGQGTGLAVALTEAINLGLVEVVKLESQTTRFPNSPIRFVRAAR